jgi:hypothetical protein
MQQDDPHTVARQGNFLISTDPTLLDVSLICDFLRPGARGLAGSASVRTRHGGCLWPLSTVGLPGFG